MLDLASSRKMPEHFLKFGNNKIQQLLNSISGIDFVMLCTSDGFEVALVNKKNVDLSGKIAAVSSSILAMVSAFIAEINLQGCKTITLDADNGKAFLTSIPHPQFPLVLVVISAKDILLGRMLFEIKDVADQLAEFNISEVV